MARDVVRVVVSEVDRDAFIQMLTEALYQLHEGSIARYRLRRSEYIAWHALVHSQPDDVHRP